MITGVAQLAEQRIPNPQVGGSNPSARVFGSGADLPERLVLMSTRGMRTAMLPELFRFALYKSRQGRLVRRATFVCLVVLCGAGSFALAGQMQGVMADNPQYAQYVRVGLPLAVWAVFCWISFRAVNVPKFADFLISVEAELERVVWPGTQQVAQATIVVLVVMFSLGIFLTVADFIWKWMFKLIGFIEY